MHLILSNGVDNRLRAASDVYIIVIALNFLMLKLFQSEQSIRPVDLNMSNAAIRCTVNNFLAINTFNTVDRKYCKQLILASRYK